MDLEAVDRHFGARVVELLREQQASKSAVAKLLQNEGLLLLAMHGSNHADQPLQSFLSMFPDDDGDGYLTAEELYRHRVSADLVVMSACYSGLADRSPLPGDDLFGIQRALLSSGAKTVVSGLWDVFDKTAPELIDGFHERLARGESSAAALANSQRAFLEKYRSTGEAEPYLHPYFWAVYTVAGDDRTTAAEGAVTTAEQVGLIQVTAIEEHIPEPVAPSIANQGIGSYGIRPRGDSAATGAGREIESTVVSVPFRPGTNVAHVRIRYDVAPTPIHRENYEE